MNDPMDSPPKDWGSDRYGYVELLAEDGATNLPDPPQWLLDKYEPPCLDCNANLFLFWNGTSWSRVIVAHDDGCPTLAKEEEITRWELTIRREDLEPPIVGLGVGYVAASGPVVLEIRHKGAVILRLTNATVDLLDADGSKLLAALVEQANQFTGEQDA